MKEDKIKKNKVIFFYSNECGVGNKKSWREVCFKKKETIFGT